MRTVLVPSDLNECVFDDNITTNMKYLVEISAYNLIDDEGQDVDENRISSSTSRCEISAWHGKS